MEKPETRSKLIVEGCVRVCVYGMIFIVQFNEKYKVQEHFHTIAHFFPPVFFIQSNQ